MRALQINLVGGTGTFVVHGLGVAGHVLVHEAGVHRREFVRVQAETKQEEQEGLEQPSRALQREQPARVVLLPVHIPRAHRTTREQRMSTAIAAPPPAPRGARVARTRITDAPLPRALMVLSSESTSGSAVGKKQSVGTLRVIQALVHPSVPAHARRSVGTTARACSARHAPAPPVGEARQNGVTAAPPSVTHAPLTILASCPSASALKSRPRPGTGAPLIRVVVARVVWQKRADGGADLLANRRRLVLEGVRHKHVGRKGGR